MRLHLFKPSVAAALLLATAASAQTGTISGVVYERSTQKPIADATVIVRGTLNGTTTKANGAYTILGVPSGTYTVEVRRPPYLVMQVTGVVVNADARRVQDFELDMNVDGHRILAEAREGRTPPPMVERGVVGIPPGLAVPGTQGGQRPPGAGAMASLDVWLFPPELVMQHQRALNLTADQRRTITEAVKALQSQTVDLQWNLQAEQQALISILEKRPINEQAAAAQMAKLVDLEDAVKRTHLLTLVKIKNALTDDQVEQLNILRHRREPTPEPAR